MNIIMNQGSYTLVNKIENLISMGIKARSSSKVTFSVKWVWGHGYVMKFHISYTGDLSPYVAYFTSFFPVTETI
jgi:hypothetical protein